MKDMEILPPITEISGVPLADIPSEELARRSQRLSEFSCMECGEQFATASLLSEHVRSQH